MEEAKAKIPFTQEIDDSLKIRPVVFSLHVPKHCVTSRLHWDV